jgi:hypothetical protein
MDKSDLIYYLDHKDVFITGYNILLTGYNTIFTIHSNDSSTIEYLNNNFPVVYSDFDCIIVIKF